ncbi:hypothetical protein Ahy_A09g041676 [Arachis hypogaea]|uniref:Endonuclease/exonuclease/phosphatase domain-containing protein n=1 Tax=Arachis hypogaea TaxID=3818 RepID=A0A445BDG4_ARAHY|nr:hypothetical protein Ahy_A09g041676 [Arachis hypogaea]
MKDSQEVLQINQLLDLEFVGHYFTWTNNQPGDMNIQERLDRAVATIDWKEDFLETIVRHLQRYRSDHCPLLIDVTGQENKRMRKRPNIFKFEKMWLQNQECKETITNKKTTTIGKNQRMENMRLRKLTTSSALGHKTTLTPASRSTGIDFFKSSFRTQKH